MMDDYLETVGTVNGLKSVKLSLVNSKKKKKTTMALLNFIN